MEPTTATITTTKLYTIRQAAQLTGAPEFALRNWCKRGAEYGGTSLTAGAASFYTWGGKN